MIKLHLDTDLGGDLDDLCALAMLLKWPGLEITGITTVTEQNGRRAGYVRYVLDLVGRMETPVAAGADLSDGYFRYSVLDYPSDRDNWPEQIPPRPGPLDEALSLLKQSIEQGAVIAAIGPFTNLILLEQRCPGILSQASVYLMGGYVYDIPSGFPAFSRKDDWNIQMDIRAAHHIIERATPTLIPLTMSCQTALRRADLPRLAQAGPLGKLIVRQAEVFARSEGFEKKYGETCPGLPKDIINFQHDPLACAIAPGWQDGVEIETAPLRLEIRDGWLFELPDPDGIPTRLVTRINAAAFNQYWCDILCS